MSNHDCVVIMPTGSGKSLTYQLPALCSDNVTIVVSPLKSLIEDQRNAMEKLGIKSVRVLNSDVSKTRQIEVFNELKQADCPIKLLYTTPETFKKKEVQELLLHMYDNKKIARIAIDEVHCVSHWGHGKKKSILF